MIIDTNIYSALRRGDQAVLRLVEQSSRICMPLPVVAELRYGFQNGTRTVANQKEMTDFLAQDFIQLLFPVLSTTEYYASLHLYAQQHGRALSNNDIWIAALAQEDGDTLVTYDKDFTVFQDLFGDKLKVLV